MTYIIYIAGINDCHFMAVSGNKMIFITPPPSIDKCVIFCFVIKISESNMKKFLFFMVLTSLMSGCAVSYDPSTSSKSTPVDFPPLDQVNTAYVGDRVVGLISEA